jgi:GxxExxY protein
MSSNLNCLTEKIIGAAIKVHKALGPGLLESTYEICLHHELVKAGLKIDRQKTQPVTYDGIIIDCGYRIDLMVENQIVLELKAVEKVLPIHEAQLLSYLRISGCKVGLLINFNTKYLKEGISRVVNNF